MINQATFVVMPSHFEAFGLVALESMQMGRPVIATRFMGLKEIVAPDTGILVDVGDPAALGAAMVRLRDGCAA